CEDVVKDNNKLMVDLFGADGRHYAQYMPNNQDMLPLESLENGAELSERVDCTVSSSELSSQDLCASHSTMNYNHLVSGGLRSDDEIPSAPANSCYTRGDKVLLPIAQSHSLYLFLTPDPMRA
ncbi:hypothetical protein PMAYCL1PPCAC_28507, partial [Pristionchus mayeri]